MSIWSLVMMVDIRITVVPRVDGVLCAWGGQREKEAERGGRY